jgi:GDPmannose 4,6-dehydratase
MRNALITGISGQDGSYLAELLLEKGYEVHGTVLPAEYANPDKALWRLTNIFDQIHLYPLNIEDHSQVQEVVRKVKPKECYHLAAASFVSYSFDKEFSVFDINLDGTHFILASLKEFAPDSKFYFAGSSEMFGKAKTFPQNEDTPFNPRSPYGVAKASGYFLTKYYRDYHKMFACSGIAYNH